MSPLINLAQRFKPNPSANVSHPDYQNEPHTIAREAAQLAKTLIDALERNNFE